MDEIRFNLGLWQEDGSRYLECTHTQAMEDLNQMLNNEVLVQEKIVDEIRFGEVDNYLDQQIEVATQKHLEESFKLLEKHLNSLKIGQIEPPRWGLLILTFQVQVMMVEVLMVLGVMVTYQMAQE